jgi:hypothetical protein
MSNGLRTRTTAQSVIMIILGAALLGVGVAGSVVGELRTLEGLGFGLIGLGFVWSGARWFLARNSGP